MTLQASYERVDFSELYTRDELYWFWEDPISEALILDTWGRGEGLELRGPSYAWITVLSGCCVLSSPLRWRTFLGDSWVRERVRLFYRAIAMSLDANVVLYVPDSGIPGSDLLDLIFEGDSYNHYVAQLEQAVGPPIAIDRLPQSASTDTSDQQVHWCIDSWPDEQRA